MQTFCEDLQETVFSSEDAQQLSQRNTVRSLCVPRPPSPVLPVLPPSSPTLSASSTSLKVSSSASVHILISAPFFSSVYFTYSFASHFLLPLLPPSPPLPSSPPPPPSVPSSSHHLSPALSPSLFHPLAQSLLLASVCRVKHAVSVVPPRVAVNDCLPFRRSSCTLNLKGAFSLCV